VLPSSGRSVCHSLGLGAKRLKRAAGCVKFELDISSMRRVAILGPIPAWARQTYIVCSRVRRGTCALPEQDLACKTRLTHKGLRQPEYATNEFRSTGAQTILVLVGCAQLSSAHRLRNVAVARLNHWMNNGKAASSCPCRSRFDLAGRD